MCVVWADLGSEVGVYIDHAVCVLCFDGEQKGAEPLERAEVAADPDKVDFAQARARLWIPEPVPDALEDGSKRRDPDASAAEHDCLELEHIFRSGAEGPVYRDRRQSPPSRWNEVARRVLCADEARGAAAGVAKVAPECPREFLGEVADAAHVNAEKVFLRC